MSGFVAALKRFIVGRPVRSDRAGQATLSKRAALPVFASDALSSVAYAPDEILLTLALAGGAAAIYSIWVGVAVAIVLLVVVASYRLNVRAYPSGGADYEITSANLGKTAGMTTASALLVDYVLTVAVSVSSGAGYVASAIPQLRGHEEIVAVAMIVFLALLNLRGIRQSGRVASAAVYLFMAAVGATAVWGFVQYFGGFLAHVPSADFEVVAADGFEQGLSGLAGALLVARAFASGSVALTGVETISKGVPLFREPKARNAGVTLSVLGVISATMMVGIVALADVTGVKFVENVNQLRLDGQPISPNYVQHPVLGQLAKAVFSHLDAMFYVVAFATIAVLLLAANTAFRGFPILGSVLARDGFLPRQLHTRGDRLALSNGIIILSALAIGLVLLFDASTTRLIQLYIVGVFISFTLSQLGMIRHWNKTLVTTGDPAQRRLIRRYRIVSVIGFVLTSVVLLIVLVTKFTHGAWLTLLLMLAIFGVMKRISRHYERVARNVEYVAADQDSRLLPSRVHAIVLVSRIHKPTMRAIAYARATRPSELEAVTVAVDPIETQAMIHSWDRLDIPVPLRVLDSPYRDITKPVLQYVKSIRRRSPRDLVVVFIPEYVVEHWWEQVLHNQSALRLKTRLLFVPGVVVASVPWQVLSHKNEPAPSLRHGVLTQGDRQRGNSDPSS